ncbi:MAG: hypothetical protein Q7T82_13405 [Armatimonadota bacterium]|nr:hypothetical protein [Armatimonadota bacterium]
MQRGTAQFIPCVDLRASCDEQPGHAAAATTGSPVQRRFMSVPFRVNVSLRLDARPVLDKSPSDVKVILQCRQVKWRCLVGETGDRANTVDLGVFGVR